jgi:hypothetical protein
MFRNRRFPQVAIYGAVIGGGDPPAETHAHLRVIQGKRRGSKYG